MLSLLLAAQATSLIAPDAYLTVPVGGLERTDARATTIASEHGQAVRVVVRHASAETNATQLTLPNSAPVAAGDVLVASLWLHGTRPNGTAARTELLFERSTDPWTKSTIRDLILDSQWKQVVVPFRAAEGYSPGTAMLSLRLAFGPQTVEIAGVTLEDRGPNASLDVLVDEAATHDPLGPVTVTLDPRRTRQTMLGLGGNFTQPRYGSVESPDAVGRYVLDHLKVTHARVGLPLDYWTPSPGAYHDDAQAAASFRVLKEMARRGIPTVVSIWEGPAWMLGGTHEASGRVLDPAKYTACIEAIAEYLVVARDKYGAKPEYVSFNEPDYGVNFKFTPATMADFIRQAGPRFAARGLKTKFLVGDTAGGSSVAAFDTPLLSDPALTPYLGPIAFHCWDVLGADDAAYEAIAALGKRFKKPVWCLEAGHDSGLWQQKDPWPTWDNALRTAMAYERTLRLAQPSRMDYWTYENDYPVAGGDGPKPYPVFDILKRLSSTFASGRRVTVPTVSNAGLQALGSVDGTGRLDLLLVNPQGAGRAIVRGLRPGAPYIGVIGNRTAQTRPVALKADQTGAIIVVLPTRSVTTLVESAERKEKG